MAAKTRHSWVLGSELMIYSRSKDTWFNGEIIDIYIDKITSKEWFVVKYNGNKKKSIQRLCKDIKPVPINLHKQTTAYPEDLTKDNKLCLVHGYVKEESNDQIPSELVKIFYDFYETAIYETAICSKREICRNFCDYGLLHG